MNFSFFRANTTRKLFLVSLPVLALTAFVWHSRHPAYLLGKWKVGTPLESWQKEKDGEAEDSATETTFKFDGTWETVLPDPNGSKFFVVLKGRYSASGSNFFLFGHKRYSRAQRADKGNDVLFVPAPMTNIGDCCDWQIYNYDQQLAFQGEDYHVVSFDQVTRKMVTEDETEFGGTKPRIEHRTWIKQP